MKVSDIRIVNYPDYCQLQAQIEMDAVGRKKFLLWYRFPLEFGSFISPSCGDPFIAALLLPAMVTGESLEIDALVSSKLLNSVTVIQDIYYCWDRSLKKVVIKAPQKEFINSTVKIAQTASFFSGGVDSLYTVLKYTHNNEKKKSGDQNPTHLILVHGFDIPIEEEYARIFEEALRNAQVVAKTLGKEIVPVVTNIRKLMDLFVRWGPFGHGACLASVGLTLQNLFNRIFIASTYNYANLFPWGSHPMLDPLWSVEDFSFIHDGCESTRLEKIRFIAQFPVALKTVRVCFKINYSTPQANLNCCRCYNCLSTMIGLQIVGALKQCETFPCVINLELVRNLSFAPPALNMTEMYHSLSSSEIDQEIKAALKAAFEKAKIDLGTENKVEKAGPAWQQWLNRINQDIAELAARGESFILVDENQLRLGNDISRRAIPFMERDGLYWGVPSDDAVAITEIERQRQTGAAYIFFAWTAFWLLEYYPGMHDYLKSNYKSVLNNEYLVGFSLEAKTNGDKR